MDNHFEGVIDVMNTTIAAHSGIVIEPRLARSAGAAGGWIVGIAWVLLGLGLLAAGLLGWQMTEATESERLVLGAFAVGIAAGTLVQFLFLFSYGVLLRGMAHLLRRVG